MSAEGPGEQTTPEQAPGVAHQQKLEHAGELAEQAAERPTYTLARFPEKLAVVRLGPGSDVPAWAESSSLFSVTATATETSVVCAARDVPTKARAQKAFTAFAVEGPLAFEEVGVLVALLTPLADAGISVFTISTFDTDWLLVPVGKADKAEEAWQRQGHTVERAVPAGATPPREPREPREPRDEQRRGKRR